MALRLRAERPTWDTYDVANSPYGSSLIASVTSEGATALKVLWDDVALYPFKDTMSFIKDLADVDPVDINTIKIASYDLLPPEYQINLTSYPDYTWQTSNPYVYFTFAGDAYALAFAVFLCGD